MSLYTPAEQELLHAWLRATPIDEELSAGLDADGIEHEPEHYSRLDAWVGQFLYRRRRVTGLKRRLGGIVWATSAPGFTFPGFYDLHVLPGLDVNVVTYSQHPSPFGYPHFGIGHYSVREPVSSVWNILYRDWHALYTVYDQSPWEEWWSGLLDQARAKAYRQIAFSNEDRTSWMRSSEGGILNPCM